MAITRYLCGMSLVCLLADGFGLHAGDWPQILGPHRNGIAADDETLNFDWDDDGPAKLWEHPLGTGFAGAAVKGARVLAFHRRDDRELVNCFDNLTGRQLWETGFPTEYLPSVTHDDGPRCVPTIAGESVIVFGSGGGLRCLDLKSGDTRWDVATHAKYRADEGYFGAGSSPLVVADRVIVNVGGSRSGAGLVAFALDDGRELWKSTSENASYSSPILASIGGHQVVVAITRMKCLAVDPKSGAVLFELPFGKRGPTVNAANPVTVDGKLFFTASYGIGAVFGRPSATSFSPLWTKDGLLSSQYTTPVAAGKVLYGVHGRQDIGVPELRCLDPFQQKVLWSEPLEDYATLIRAGDRLLVLTVGGELIVVRADSSRYSEFARAKVADATPRGAALPALSNGLFYVRDDKALRCFDLRKP